MEAKPLAEMRQDLSKFIDDAVTTHARYDITRNGKRAAVLLSADDYDSIMETLSILSDPQLVVEIREGLREAADGEVTSHEGVVAELASTTGR